MKQFKEGLNTAVFTTRFIIEDGEPITSVLHYEDGSWQFSGDQTDLTDSDYKVISLGQALNLDDTISELSDMSIGFAAFRNGKNDKWKIEPLTD